MGVTEATVGGDLGGEEKLGEIEKIELED